MGIYKKFLLLFIPCYIHATQYLNQEPIQESSEVWMIIFVHGTSGAMSNASFSNIYRIMLDEVENTPYEKAVDLIRTNPYMYQNQPMQQYGLHPVDYLTRKPGKAAALFAYIYDTVLQEAFSHQKRNIYYTYGWSGVLSESIRYKNALRFYDELSLEYKKQCSMYPGQKVKICIVSYSHGGTVALQLARVYEKERLHNPLCIDMLITLGTPIQKETDYLVTHAIFKKVYHIYSRGDKVQKLDFFSFRRFFSKRRFNDTSRFVTPEKVVQIELQLKPARRKYKDHEKPTYVNRSPGHIELWFFGWTEGMYRKDFPLHPLPAACMIPIIIKAAMDSMPQENDLVVELYPHTEKCIVKKRRYFKKIHTKGIKQETLRKIKKIACDERPETFNRKEYLNHMHSAIKQAYGKISEKHTRKICGCDS
ncbi:MAG: hypothetical protein K2X90_04645 [Candidatus Babeliaceae bacterium]|nr:hypothetical protein [Candidatus Babeliaceae bacterium]